MAIFISHAIFYVKVKEGEQTEYPVWENVYIVVANSVGEARLKARKIAEGYEEDTKEVFLDGRPALQLFKGIRKVIGYEDCEDTILETKMKDGEEITYSRYTVKSEKDVARLASGEQVSLKYIE